MENYVNINTERQLPKKSVLVQQFGLNVPEWQPIVLRPQCLTRSVVVGFTYFYPEQTLVQHLKFPNGRHVVAELS